MEDLSCDILIRQAAEHLAFDDDLQTYRAVWRINNRTFLPITVDSDPRLTEEAMNRDELRGPIRSEFKQITTGLLYTYMSAHHGERERAPFSLNMRDYVSKHVILQREGLNDRGALKTSLEEIAFRNLHTRTVAIALIEAVENHDRLVRDFPVVNRLVAYIANDYMINDCYGIELLVTVGPGKCDLALNAGRNLGPRDNFVRFV